MIWFRVAALSPRGEWSGNDRFVVQRGHAGSPLRRLGGVRHDALLSDLHCTASRGAGPPHTTGVGSPAAGSPRGDSERSAIECRKPATGPRRTASERPATLRFGRCHFVTAGRHGAGSGYGAGSCGLAHGGPALHRDRQGGRSPSYVPRLRGPQGRSFGRHRSRPGHHARGPARGQSPEKARRPAPGAASEGSRRESLCGGLRRYGLRGGPALRRQRR